MSYVYVLMLYALSHKYLLGLACYFLKYIMRSSVRHVMNAHLVPFFLNIIHSETNKLHKLHLEMLMQFLSLVGIFTAPH